jgi:mono/diheme cytochrome c family protein
MRSVARATAVLVPLVVLPAGGADAQQPSLVARGRAIAEQKCAHCHAIGRDDERPHAIVIPFRDLPTRFPVDMLVEARKTGVISGHDEMPMFELPGAEMTALLVYIDSFAPAHLRYIGP